MLFSDNFSTDLQNWTLRGTSCMGKWSVNEGALVYDLAAPNDATRGFIGTRHRFRQIAELKVDFCLPQCEKFEVDFWLRSFDYTAICKIMTLPDGRFAARYQRNDSPRYTGMKALCTTPFDKGLLHFGQKQTLCMQIEGQTVSLRLDGQSVLQLEVADYPVDDAMQIQLKTTVDGTKFYDFAVSADEVFLPEKETAAPPSQNQFTAQIEAGQGMPWGFTQTSGETLWATRETDFGAAYGIEAQKDYSQTWAFAFENNPTVTAKVVCMDPAVEAQCGLLARFAVEDSFVQAGYDFACKAWFIAATLGRCYTTQRWQNADAPAFPVGELVELRLEAKEDKAALYANGQLMVKAEGIYNLSYGRMGLFAKGAKFYATAFHTTLPSGGQVVGGVTEQTVAPDLLQAHLEIERLDENTIFGLFKNQRHISYDCGDTFQPAPPSFDNTGYGLSYPSMHRRRTDGKFLQLLCLKNFLVQESDDLQNWRDLCHILPPEQVRTPEGESLSAVHVSSFTEIDMPDGSTRLFLPICLRLLDENNRAAGHRTRVYYSDDGGNTWQMSKKNLEDLPRFANWTGSMSWCESKIIPCVDGRLRMLCTRKIAPNVHYVDSFDYGETWTEYGEFPDMPTPTSSYAVCQDPTAEGTYFMVYVNSQPHFHATIFPRDRITLVRTDGLTFTPVMDIDRFTNNEVPEEGMAELYQILDPCVAVFEDYIFVSFGRSNDMGGLGAHNAQRSRFVRIDRKLAGI